MSINTPDRAWVTLATNDSYGLGALVLAHSLRRAASAYPAVVLITPSVTEAMRNRLSAVFAEVVTVDVLDSRDAAHLALLQRPELGITFTKIHCWSLTQYQKCVFLDADTLIIQNCDELFEREELSAAPDVGWPDCFNSGVFVYTPSAETFSRLIAFAQERGSFDGGDQGLLNAFFSDWAHGDINRHLPFLYNVTSAAFYSYVPALKHYGQDLKIIHFIGAVKPWLQQFNWDSRTVDGPEHLREFLQLWWDIFVGQVHSQLETTMSGVAGNLARVVPGEVSYQREALDELSRRQGWEAGNIDYMGADSFDNIWAKISQTLNQPRTSPPKQPSPPKEQPAAEPIQGPAPVEAPVSLEAAAPATEASPVAEVSAPASDAATAVVTSTATEVTEPSLAPDVPASPEVPTTEAGPEKTEALVTLTNVTVPTTVEEVLATVESTVPTVDAVATEAPKQEVTEKTEPTLPPTPPVSPKSTPESSTPVTETPPKIETTSESQSTPTEGAVPEEIASSPASPAPAAVAPASPAAPEAAKPETTPEKAADTTTVSTDSPPLANTPSKEEVPAAPAAKSEERRKPAGKLQLSPPAAADPLPTPDSELEDAAALAQSIIASELSTTVTSPSPSADPASPPPPVEEKRLSVDEPQVPTPPVSLAQIGVKPKGKATTAAQIASSVSEKEPTPASPTTTVPSEPSTPTDAPPKKKIVKKVVKKEGGSSGAGDASMPVPPPRKKEKKPKEK